MKKHFYVLTSVFLWGSTQFMLSILYQVISPVLALFLVFLTSGLILALPHLSGRTGRKVSGFSFRYLLTGGLGMTGYYLLAAAALSLSSVPFVVIMEGFLPIVSVMMEMVMKRRVPVLSVIGAGLSMTGVIIYAMEAGLKGNLTAALLMIAAELSWVFYTYLKKRWNLAEGSRVLGYEFLSAAILILPLCQLFQIKGPVLTNHVMILVWVILCAMILPYQLYQKGSAGLPLSTSSMYMNLLPVISLLPNLLAGTLHLQVLQWTGIGIIILAAVLGSRAEEKLPNLT